jgi:hypothetical protein
MAAFRGKLSRLVLFIALLHVNKELPRTLCSATDKGSCRESADRCHSNSGRRIDWNTVLPFNDTRPLGSAHELLRELLAEIRRRHNARGPHCEQCANEKCCNGCTCLHGVCTQEGACLCEGDWFGDACDTNPTIHAYHLPEKHPRETDSRRTQQRKFFFEQAITLVKSIDALQHDHACKKLDENGEPALECHIHVVLTQVVYVLVFRSAYILDLQRIRPL